VTHVLAEQTRVRGLLEVSTGYEQFDLFLDRSGDEEAILRNIYSCNEAIRTARSLCDLDEVSSASFQYPVTDGNTLSLGLQELKRALPYLYATRKNLGRVELELGEGGTEVWSPGQILRESIEDGFVHHRSLRVEHKGRSPQEIHVFRFSTSEAATASALLLVEQMEAGCRVRLPEPDAPRVYREYPLRGSGFLPINFVLDGKFDPDQERIGLLMSDEDKELIEDALNAAVAAVKYAFHRKWEDRHLLAQACKPTTAFYPTNADEKQWWTDRFAEFAGRIATLPIVECSSQFLPAITSEGCYADFIIPRVLASSRGDETTVNRMWPLAEAATDLFPPCMHLAQDWTQIAEGWRDLGLQGLGLVAVSDLAKYVREEAELLDQLQVTGDPKKWLAKFIDIVGECWSKRSGVEIAVLAGMLPNQNQHLCSPKELSRDSGVPERLKDICTNMGYDVRSQLLLGDFYEIAGETNLTYLADAIEKAIPTCVSENDVIEEAVKHMEANLPEDEDYDQETADLQKASVHLLHYLWESKQENAASMARRLPFITSKGRAVRWSQDRMMMAPVCSWHESARPFANAYPPNRILAELYAGSEEYGTPNTVLPLVNWGIAIADPITVDTPVELKERRLAAICHVNTEGVVISGEKFSQIALLQPELLNRCQEGIEEARALLGLVLCHVAPHDPRWLEESVLKARKSREDLFVPVRGALWLADLKFRAWVPVPGEDEKPVKMVANATTLKNLLNPSWLEGNNDAIRLLSEWFEFDELELRLLGIEPDADKRQELRNRLARLLESGGPNPDLYTSLVAEVEARRRRQRDIDRCRRLGIAVQDAIKSAMESYGLEVKLVDRGFDFEVTLSTDDVLEEAATRFQVGPYLLEVKATTKGEARLTPLQAQTAPEKPFRYVLCVVDLRKLPEEDLDKEWTSVRVESLAKIVPDIGGKVKETCLLVEAARSRSVAIRNESALRYEVPVSVWESGISITSWVAEISSHVPEADLK
jgi:hypothetical protein